MDGGGRKGECFHCVGGQQKTGNGNLRAGGTEDWKERGLERHQCRNPADTTRKAMQGQQERPTVLKIDHQ